jgi:hypothetical protein
MNRHHPVDRRRIIAFEKSRLPFLESFSLQDRADIMSPASRLGKNVVARGGVQRVRVPAGVQPAFGGRLARATRVMDRYQRGKKNEKGVTLALIRRFTWRINGAARKRLVP